MLKMNFNMKYFKLVIITLLSITLNSQAAPLQSPMEAPEGVEKATPQDLIEVFHNGGRVYDLRWHYSGYEFSGHIPFAEYVPYTEYSAKSKDFDIKKDIWDYSVLPKDKETPIGFVCGGIYCWKSYKLTTELARRGYTNIYWLREGQAAWDKAALPVLNRNPILKPMRKIFSGENEPTTWIIDSSELKEMFDEEEDIKVIDFRDKESFTKGRLQSAFYVPVQRVLTRDGLKLIPEPKLEYKIVLVSKTGTLAATAAAPLAALGYKVKVLDGGMDAWKAKFGDENTVKGPVEVNWTGPKDWKSQIIKLKK